MRRLGLALGLLALASLGHAFTIHYLVVGGGGGGAAGGGGAGGFATGTATVSTSQSITVNIGLGGAGVINGNPGANANPGGDSWLGAAGAITRSAGGGGGGGVNRSNDTGINGGSGGGSGGTAPGSASGGTGVSGQGYAGGNVSGAASPYPSGGGGGASVVGQSVSSNYGGAGGTGTASTITGSSVYYAGGGGGGVYLATGYAFGKGGPGGGGDASGSGGANGTDGLGGGGGGSAESGGSCPCPGGNGGKGVAIISEPQSDGEGTCGACTITTDGSGNYVYSFSASDTWIAPNGNTNTYTPTPNYTLTDQALSWTPTFTNSNTYTPTPTFTPTPYCESFGEYTPGANLTTTPTPGYVAHGSVSSAVVVTDASLPGGQAGQVNASVWGFVAAPPDETGYQIIQWTVDTGARFDGGWDTTTWNAAGYPNAGYWVQLSSGAWFIEKGNGLTVVANGTYTGTLVNAVIEVIDDGSGNITLIYNGTTLWTGSDSTYNSGYVSVGTYLGSINFQLCIYASPLPTPTPVTYTPTPNYTLTDAALSWTPTQTPWPTPTPQATVPLCTPTPWPVVFTPVLTPLIIPQTTPEGGFTGEPSVIDIAGDTTTPYHMFYRGGWNANIALFLATSASPTGPFTKQGPKLGSGYGSYADGLAYPTQIDMSVDSGWSGPRYRVYAHDPSTGATPWFDSADGYTYTYEGVAVASSAIDNLCGGPGPETFDGGYFWDGTNWWSTQIWVTGSCAAAGNEAYVTWLMKSTDHGQTFHPAANVPLWSMEAAGADLFCSGRGNNRSAAGNYYLVSHQNVPSQLYMSKSNDLYNWKTYPQPIATPAANLFGLSGCNQTADAHMLQDGGNLYVYYDGTDNANSAGRIGYLIYHGTLDTMDGCLIPTFTPTPTPFTAISGPTKVKIPHRIKDQEQLLPRRYTR